MKKLFKRLVTLVLAITLVFGVAQFDVQAAANTYKINGVSVSVNSFNSSPNECWWYANHMYKKIWGHYFTNQFSDSENSLRNLSDKELTLTPEHLKAYVLNAPVGSVLRVCDKKYLHANDGWGHSQIIVQKDSNGFTVLEGGLSAFPYKREHYYTWDGFCNSSWPGKYQYIKYVKWPGAPEFEEPTGTLSVTYDLSSSNITLAWTSYWDYTDKYEVKRATSTDGSWTTVKTITDGSMTWTDNTVKPGTQYYYKVLPYNDDGDTGNYTNQVSALTRSKLTTTAESSDTPSITLNWTKTAGYTASYKVFRATDPDGTWVRMAVISDGDTTTWTDTQVIPGIKYYYKVLAYNAAGKSGPYSSMATDKAVKLSSEPFDGVVSRVYGDNRYKTSYQAANELKESLGIDSFDAVVLATGQNFADALSGSYLAYVKNAPILLTNGKDDASTVKAYLNENLSSDGTVYILGGTSAVSEDVEKALEGFHIIRLKGNNRYETNMEILKAAEVTAEDMIVCTGTGYADSLSASAVKKPILLVSDQLSDVQEAYLDSLEGDMFYIAGGTAAVPFDVETDLREFGTTKRLGGSTRYETSVRIAEEFSADPSAAVIAYGGNFPDGLCGGPLAASMDAPLIITHEDAVYTAYNYVNSREIKEGLVLGGTVALSDVTVKVVFDMSAKDTIIEKKYK